MMFHLLTQREGETVLTISPSQREALGGWRTMTRIDGWQNSQDAKLIKRANELVLSTGQYDDILYVKRENRSTHVRFSGELKQGSKLSPRQICLYIAGGDLPFGGECYINEDWSFVGKYNSDEY